MNVSGPCFHFKFYIRW